MLTLCIGDVRELAGGQLFLASLPPLGGASDAVRRIVVDSRQARPGDVFWGLKGPLYDGGLYAAEAFANGAIGVVAGGRRIEPWAGRFSVLVEDPNGALLRLAERYPAHRRASSIGTAAQGWGTPLTDETIDALLRRDRTGFAAVLARLAEREFAPAGEVVA